MIQGFKMKIFNLRIIVSLLLLSASFTACKKSQGTEKTGIIHLDGYLYNCLGCPGGPYDMVFTNDSIPYRIGNDLTPFGITTMSSFPISVTVTSKFDTDNANGTKSLIITSLKINK